MAEPKKRSPNWRARLAAMPPIDWAALAAEHRARSTRLRKGDKRPAGFGYRIWRKRWTRELGWSPKVIKRRLRSIKASERRIAERNAERKAENARKWNDPKRVADRLRVRLYRALK